MVAATLVTLAAGAALKQPCASGRWTDGRQYRRLCYSDIVPLYGTERLTGGRLPYLDPCPRDAGEQCDEYPVLTMYFMRTSAWISQGVAGLAGHTPTYAGFFYANALLLVLCALATTWALWRMAGVRALYFALAPTLLIYGFVNWDLLAVALATCGTLTYLRRRDALAGIFLGLGTAAKLYPALLLIPFVLGRLRERRSADAWTLIGVAGTTYALANLPFVIASPHSWATFFRFNSQRGADWDSLWFIACQRLHGGIGCGWSGRLLDAWSLALFAALAGSLWWARRHRDPGFPRWTFGFPLIVAFLLTNKVYSPQYGLWLLPWFGLALPNPWLFGAFELADVAVFVTRFSWFGRLSADLQDPAFAGYHGVPLGGFQIALLVRAAVLMACLAAWVLQSGNERALLPFARINPAPAGVMA